MCWVQLVPSFCFEAFILNSFTLPSSPGLPERRDIVSLRDIPGQLREIKHKNNRPFKSRCQDVHVKKRKTSVSPHLLACSLRTLMQLNKTITYSRLTQQPTFHISEHRLTLHHTTQVQWVQESDTSESASYFLTAALAGMSMGFRS